VKTQIYRRSTLTISGFNVIFILHFPQALCPSCTFRLWTEKERSVGGVGGVGGAGGKQIFYCLTWGIWLLSSQVYCESGKKGICRVKTGENFFIPSLFLSLVFLFLLMWLFFSTPSLFILPVVVFENPFRAQIFIWFVLSCSDFVWCWSLAVFFFYFVRLC